MPLNVLARVLIFDPDADTDANTNTVTGADTSRDTNTNTNTNSNTRYKCNIPDIIYWILDTRY